MLNSRSLQRTVLSIALAALALACDPTTHPLSRSLPWGGDVRMSLSNSAPGEEQVTSPELLRLRELAESLNDGTERVLELVHSLMQAPATTVDGDTRTWGPGQDSPFHNGYWTLMATENADGSCHWVLSGINRRFEDAYWVVGNGHVEDCQAATADAGDFCFYPENWSHVSEENLPADETFLVEYERGGDEVDLSFDSESGDQVRWSIHFSRNPDNSASMREKGAGPFSLQENFAQVVPTGAGRSESFETQISDARGGSAAHTSSQCWDDLFYLVYFGDSSGSRAGDEALCAFESAPLPSPAEQRPPVAEVCDFPVVGDRG